MNRHRERRDNERGDLQTSFPLLRQLSARGTVNGLRGVMNGLLNRESTIVPKEKFSCTKLITHPNPPLS